MVLERDAWTRGAEDGWELVGGRRPVIRGKLGSWMGHRGASGSERTGTLIGQGCICSPGRLITAHTIYLNVSPFIYSVFIEML